MTIQTARAPARAPWGGLGTMAIDERFRGTLNMLRAYKTSPEGSRATGIPRSAVMDLPDGTPFPLGERAKELRRAYARGEMAADRIEALEAIPGWTWAQGGSRAKDARWRQKYDRVVAYYEAHDTLVGLRKVDPTADRWLYAQREQLETLSPEQRADLEAIPGAITPENQHGDVFSFAQDLAAWYAANPGAGGYLPRGATLERDGRTITIGRRAAHYRDRYAEGSLDPEEIHAITAAAPSWQWQAPDPVERLVQATTQYLAEHPDQHLATIAWDATTTLDGETINVGQQIAEYRRRDHEKVITPTQRRLLRTLPGWAAQPRATRRADVATFVIAARHYLDQNPGTTLATIPYNATVPRPDGTNYQLGRAANRYRKRHHAGELDRASVAALRELERA